VATFPLTIYYFHQFPSYFLLSNLFVIPGAYIILVFGLPMLVVGALLEFIGEFVGFWLNQVISILNAIVAFIDQLPGSVINWLYFDHIETVLIYLIIILFLITFHYRSRSAFILFCGLFITINFWQLHLIYDHHHRQQMVVYHTEEALAIDLIRGNNVELLSNAEKTDAEEIEANVNPFRLSSGLPSVDMEERQKKWKSIGPFHLITWSDRKILVLDQELEGFTFTTPMTCDILILSGNAVKSLATLPDQIEFDQLIIAGDNHWWVAKKLKREARELKLPVHSIKEDGYWMLDLG
ncbi:MAG: ComEC/Rec2 family competence protein, partial [Cyclobacteriaceae bacterium]|nr:ComEC/Rec2 family competence protein [Cyclobacteriaceae bacterium HetDA_MAG_MS6]